MAQGQYQKLYNTLKGAGVVGKTTQKTKQQSLKSQIDNYTTRLNSSGVDTSKIEDDRNFVEKALNLDKNQGLIFDIFEVLGRPQQAIFGGIENTQRGKDFWEGAKEGLTGDKETQFKKILTNMGIEDEKGKIDFSDVAGFLGDVFLDPVDLIPVAGFDKFGDAIKAGDDVFDAARHLKSTSDVLLEGTVKGVKGTGKLADKGIEKGLTKLDEIGGITYGTTKTDQIANLQKTIDEVKILEKSKKTGKGIEELSKGKLEVYKDIKDTIAKNFNYGKNISKDISKGVREGEVASKISAMENNKVVNELNDAFKKYADNVAAKTGGKVDDILTKVNDDALFYLENTNMYKNGSRVESASKVINDGVNGKILSGSINKEGKRVLEDIAKDVNDADLGYTLTIKEKDGILEFNDGWKKALDDDRLDMDKINNSVINLKSTLNNKQKHRLKLLDEEYKKGEDFKKLIDDIEQSYNKSNEILNKNFKVGINSNKFGDNLDYVRHAQNKENIDAYKELMDIYKGDGINSATKTVGNTSVLSARDINGSVAEVNNYYSKQLKANWDNFDKDQKKIAKKIMSEGVFKNGYTDAFSTYLENVPKTAKYGKNFDTVMTKAALGDYQELKKIEDSIDAAIKSGDSAKLKELYAKKAEALDNSCIKVLSKNDNNIPRGYIKLDKEQVKALATKGETLSKQLGLPQMDDFASFIRHNGSDIAINSEVYRLIDISSNAKETKGFVRLYDKYLSTFKKFKVLSPTFQMNNIVGNMSNMYLAGVGVTDQARLYPKAFDILTKGDDLVKAKAAGEILTKEQDEIVSIWREFNEAGFGDIGKMTSLDLNEMPDSLKSYFNGEKSFSEMSTTTKIKDFLPYVNNKMNQQFDTISRMTVFLKGKESSSFLTRLGVEDAGEAVRRVLFDPSELTQFEQDVMKRAVPFYTFTKKNLAFQVDNLSKNGSQYNKLMKGYSSLLDSATGGNEENVSDWLKNNMYIPIPSLGEDGSYKVLRVQLPFGNLIDNIDDPLGAATSLVTPLARVPIELTTGVNSYTGRDIEKYAGQKSSTSPLTKKQEYLLGNLTGLDAPLKAAYRAYNGVSDTMNNGGNIMESIGKGLESSATLSQNINNDELTKMYDRLDKLEDLVSKYKDEVGELPTIKELNATNTNNKVSNILKTVNKVNGVKSNPYSKLNKSIGA